MKIPSCQLRSFDSVNWIKQTRFFGTTRDNLFYKPLFFYVLINQSRKLSYAVMIRSQLMYVRIARLSWKKIEIKTRF